MCGRNECMIGHASGLTKKVCETNFEGWLDILEENQSYIQLEICNQKIWLQLIQVISLLLSNHCTSDSKIS